MSQAIKKIKVGDETHPIDGAFYLGTLTTVAGSGSSGSYKSVRWYVSDCEGVTAPYDGMRIAIKIPLAGVGTAGVILSINGNNDADYHPLAYNVNTVLTTHFPVNSIKVFVYDASATMTCYKTANTSVSVTGVWKADSNYDSNTVVTYGTLEYYFRPYVATEALYRYKFVMLDKDNRLVPLTTTNVANGTAVTNQTPTAKAFKPDKIWWYATTTTISASAVVGAQTLWRSGYNANNTTNGGMAICNFNSTISAYRLIYLCGTFDKTTGLFSLRGGGTASSTQYYTQVPTNTANITLSSYFTSGYDYILLGGTYSSNTYIQLFDNNPMFHFDGTNLVPYDTWNTAQASSNQKVQGNGTGFGADATVNIVGGGNVTVTGDATNNKITVSYTTPGSLKNPNPLDIYGNTTSVLSYDGSAKKSLYFKSSTSLGYFTVGDGTTSQAVYVGYSNTDTHYTSTFTVYGGSTSVATFNQSANMTLSFAAGNNVTLTPDATNHKITISATAPAATGYAGTLALSATSYGTGTQTLSQLYASNISYPGTMNITANPAVVGQANGGYLYLNAGSGIDIAGDEHIFLNTGSAALMLNWSGYTGTTVLYTANLLSIYAGSISMTASSQVYTSSPYASIYASGTNGVTTGTTSYAGILLSASAANAKVRILGYNGIEQSTIGGPLHIRTNYTNINGTAGSNPYGSIYIMAGSQLSMTASNSITVSCNYSITLYGGDAGGNGVGLWFKRNTNGSVPVVTGYRHNIKFYCQGRWNVRFELITPSDQAAVCTSTGSWIVTNNYATLSKLATLLYNAGYTSEVKACPACGGYITGGLSPSGYINGIYATASNNRAAIYFVYGNTAYSNSSAALSFSTTGNSSYCILYDDRRALQ